MVPINFQLKQPQALRLAVNALKPAHQLSSVPGEPLPITLEREDGSVNQDLGDFGHLKITLQELVRVY